MIGRRRSPVSSAGCTRCCAATWPRCGNWRYAPLREPRAPDVRAGLAALETQGPLFQLRANCLGYCQLLHSHHGGEDHLLFPAVRRAAPHLGAAMDRLESDHREVATLLAEIESLADDLEREPTRHALVDVLNRLSAELLEHLAFEEETIGPVLDGWPGWPEPAAD